MANLTDQLTVLNQVLELVDGRVPPETQARAREVMAHASRRLAAGPQTVVALAGATGSGKSSLFNALSGTQLAEQGPRRPTTSTTLAVSFSASNDALLDLLGVARRHEAAPPSPQLADLVLLDLPDHDSTVSAHRDEVDRMVTTVDQFVWVLDPQKYADAAIHQRYLRPLAQHREVITVVLNQADRLSASELAECLRHIRVLLDEDGLTGVPLLATSAVTGLGVDELRGQLATLATQKRAAATRLAADVTVVSDEMHRAVGEAKSQRVTKDARAKLVARLSASAGVELVVDAVRGSAKHRGGLATGWPLVKWIARFKPDPLARLRLGGRKDQAQLESPGLTRSSLPERSSAAEAHLSTALRTLTNDLSQGMPRLWQDAVRRAVHTGEAALPDALDRAVVSTNLKQRTPVWWQLIRVLQWLLIGAVAVGVAWLTLNVVLSYFALPRLEVFPIGVQDGLEVPTPTLLVVGGVVLGLILSAVSGVIIRISANRSARRARKALTASVTDVARDLVIAPAEQEVRRHAEARALLDRLR